MTAVAVVIAVVLGGILLSQEEDRPRSMRFVIPAEEQFDWPQISPDGTTLAYLVYDSSGGTRIWVRPLNSLEAYPLPGTEGAYRPFWSPDSKYLAYFARSATAPLRKVPVAGGQPQVIGNIAGADGCWGTQDIILFDHGQNDPLYMVSASGGNRKAITKIDSTAGEYSHAWPWSLPDGRHFIFAVYSDSVSNISTEMILKMGSIDDTETKSLGIIESRPV